MKHVVSSLSEINVCFMSQFKFMTYYHVKSTSKVNSISFLCSKFLTVGMYFMLAFCPNKTNTRTKIILILCLILKCSFLDFLFQHNIIFFIFKYPPPFFVLAYIFYVQEIVLFSSVNGHRGDVSYLASYLSLCLQ